jgi:hypothetical protein
LAFSPERFRPRASYFEASTSSDALPSHEVMVPIRISRVSTLDMRKLIFFLAIGATLLYSGLNFLHPNLEHNRFQTLFALKKPALDDRPA